MISNTWVVSSLLRTRRRKARNAVRGRRRSARIGLKLSMPGICVTRSVMTDSGQDGCFSIPSARPDVTPDQEGPC